MAMRNVVAPAPQPEPPSRLKSATHDVNFLRSDSRCRRYVSDLSNITPRCLVRSSRARFRCCGGSATFRSGRFDLSHFGLSPFGLADSVTGRFGLGRFSLETFRSDYEILQKSCMLTF